MMKQVDKLELAILTDVFSDCRVVALKLPSD